MWTPTTRRQLRGAGLRYETDLTDAEWAVIAPLMPRPEPRGRPSIWTPREILNAIFYVLRGGIAWRMIPKDLPPRSTTFGYFSRWRDAGLFGQINHHLVMADRERVGREASASAAVLDSQTVKTMESGGPRGYDAGKKVKGRKRQALSTRTGVRSSSIRSPPTYRTGTEPFRCYACRAGPSRSLPRPSPTPAMPATRRRARRSSPSRSCASRQIRLALLFIHAGGSLNDSSPGSAATDASGRIRKRPSPPPEPSSTPQPS